MERGYIERTEIIKYILYITCWYIEINLNTKNLQREKENADC